VAVSSWSSSVRFLSSLAKWGLSRARYTRVEAESARTARLSVWIEMGGAPRLL
jgi:hypothetical protein